MLRTIQVPLPPDPDLVQTMEVYNKAVQDVLDYGWDKKIYNKNKLHYATYYAIRQRYPQLQSSLVQCARDMASDMLKREKFKHRKPIKRMRSAIRYNQRTFTPFLKKGILSISTIKKRKRYQVTIPAYFQQYLNGEVKSLTIKIVNKNRIVALLGVELPDRAVNENISTFLGIDRGINRVVVLSNNRFWNTNHIKAVRWKYQQLRTHLQQRGTRSAKRKLRKVSGREQRFMKDVNYQLANWIITQPFDCIVLENLKGIKKRIRSKKLRKRGMNWAYYQLEQFIIHKAEQAGKMVLFVNPHYTSQCCSQCGYISRKNRQHQSIFHCKECGFELNADLNAARNISKLGTAVLGRASVNSPNVACDEVKCSYKEQLRRSIVTNPPTSVGGN